VAITQHNISHSVRSDVPIGEAIEIAKHIPDTDIMQIGFDVNALSFDITQDYANQMYNVRVHNSTTNQSVQHHIPTYVISSGQQRGSSMASDTLTQLSSTYSTSAGHHITTGTSTYYDTNTMSPIAPAHDDMYIAGRSIKDFMDDVSTKLAILRPNIELEEQWNELKDLREQYIAKEKEIKEKMKMWDDLNKDG